MKTYRPAVNVVPVKLQVMLRKAFIPLLLCFLCLNSFSQELIFQNPVLESGTAGQDGAVYRFSGVADKIDALVTINGRSSSKVKLDDIDLSGIGFGKSFQPKVSYNDGTVSTSANWWMEFQISFVTANTTSPVSVNSFDVTGLDIDGDGDRLHEYVSFYNMHSYMLESGTLLGVSNLIESLLGILTTVGKEFDGPYTNFTDIDTSATQVMATSNYVNTNTFRIRTGAVSTGSTNAADRMYSFWFKSFDYSAPVESPLPVKLTSFVARRSNDKVVLNWSTAAETNTSHFVIERSFDGSDYEDAGIVFTDQANSTQNKDYQFTDAPKTSDGMVYYRLRIVDMDGHVTRSTVVMVRMDTQDGDISIQAYPNPVTSELRITIPPSWQDKKVEFSLINTMGQIVKRVVVNSAGQTQVLNVQDIGVGSYIVQVSSGNETAIQRIVRTR